VKRQRKGKKFQKETFLPNHAITFPRQRYEQSL
jgi:hypothetical protein